MAGNLEGWGIAKKEENRPVAAPTSDKKFLNLSVAIDTGKKYGKEIVSAVSALIIVLSAAFTYYQVNVNKDVPVVVKQDIKDIKNDVQALRNESTDLTNKAIKTANDPISGPNDIKSRFSGPGIRADLIFPDKPVGVYKLVKIRTDEESKFYDLFVMTVNNGKIIFVDSVATANKGEWVFTGPPGDYAIRLSAYNPDIGVKVTVGNVVIGGDIPPGPTPPPGPVKVIVPTLTGMTYEQARLALEAIGLKIQSQTQVGVITAQIPAPTTLVDSGYIVVVTVTDNPAPPPVPVFTEKYGFSTLSFSTVSTKIAVEDRKYATMLADNFEAVAAGIAAGSWRTPDEANKELAGRNRLTFNNDTALITKWMPFFEAWSAKAKELNTSGKLPNMVDEYRLVYIETSKGLRAVK